MITDLDGYTSMPHDVATDLPSSEIVTAISGFFCANSEELVPMNYGYDTAVAIAPKQEQLAYYKSLVTEVFGPVFYLLFEGNAPKNHTELMDEISDPERINLLVSKNTIKSFSIFDRLKYRLWFRRYYRFRMAGLVCWFKVRLIAKTTRNGRIQRTLANIERRRIAWKELSDFWLDNGDAGDTLYGAKLISRLVQQGISIEQQQEIVRHDLAPVLWINDFAWIWTMFDVNEVEMLVLRHQSKSRLGSATDYLISKLLNTGQTNFDDALQEYRNYLEHDREPSAR